ncbi:MAG: hypothetical protein V1797_00180 [Pseudomonadota bacterium]
MDIKKPLKSWNGLLLILFIGLYLMFPAIKSTFVNADTQFLEVDQIQLFVGGLAVIWALKTAWDKFHEKKDV